MARIIGCSPLSLGPLSVRRRPLQLLPSANRAVTTHGETPTSRLVRDIRRTPTGATPGIASFAVLSSHVGGGHPLCRLLAVDTSRSNRRVIARVLQRSGWSAATTVGGVSLLWLVIVSGRNVPDWMGGRSVRRRRLWEGVCGHRGAGNSCSATSSGQWWPRRSTTDRKWRKSQVSTVAWRCRLIAITIRSGRSTPLSG